MSEGHIFQVLLQFGILLFSLCLHEFGHAAMADRLGDPTPRLLGRLTLNPMAHADLLGTIILPLFQLFNPGLRIFGWAKPVPVTPENLKNPRWDSAKVAFAGPLANICLCFCALAAFAVLDLTGFFGVSESFRDSLTDFFNIFFWINFTLAILNLIPIFPLDGSWILKAFLPPSVAYSYSRLERYGAVLLLLAFFLGWLKYYFMPATWALFSLLDIAGLHHLAGYLS